MEVIDKGAVQIAVVVDAEWRLLGIVTDGDIRRGFLKGLGLESPVSEVMNSDPFVLVEGQDHEPMLNKMKQVGFRQIPIIDASRRVIGVEILDGLLIGHRKENIVVLMAGGQGQRLLPLTKDCPKPLLKIGSKPILEIILDQLIAQGFYKFRISVNYMSELFVNYFGKGEKWGVEIDYLLENTRLGTAGSLSLMKDQPTEPILVMNADLLTKVNCQQLLDFHIREEAEATVCVREFQYQIPYGVVEVRDQRILSIREKPQHSELISGGIYVLEPEALEHIPAGSALDMPQLLQKILLANQKIVPFPVLEYWQDIGRVDDFERAVGEFSAVFE